MPVAGATLAVVLCWSLLACSNAGDAAYGRGMDLYSAKRYAEAATHLEHAAQADHVLGMATLASMLLKGEGVPRDATQAALWFEKAANLGNVECQSIIGLLYFNGIGVQHDPAKARTWLSKAAGNGDKQSAWILENLAERGAARF